MPSSVEAVSPPPPKPSLSDNDDSEEGFEYEEIEVEEEVEFEEEEEIEEEVDGDDEEEVEEEVEEEPEEDEEPEIGEDLTPVREENQGSDIYQIMEPEVHEVHNKSEPVISVTPGVSVLNRLTDIPTTLEGVGDFKTLESNENESSHVHGERTSGDNDLKARLDDGGEVGDVQRKPFVGDVNVALMTNDASREKDSAILSVVAETNHTAVKAVEDIQQISPRSPRLHVPQIRLRDSSSSAEYDGENKRQKIVCEFHAKGWCIKGNSCRFLHINERLDSAVKKSEVKREAASSSAFIEPQHSGENSKLNGGTDKLILPKDGVLGSDISQPDRESVGQNSVLDNYSCYAPPLVRGSSFDRNSTYPGNFSGFPSISKDNHHNSRVSTFGTALDKKGDMARNDHRSADVSYSHFRRPLPLGMSSWTSNALGTQNLVGSSVEHRASVPSSLQRSTSLFSCSESKSVLGNFKFRDTEPDMYKSKVSSNDWEPSAPFIPSHVITRDLLKESLYDPIHDSIEHTDAGDGRTKFSYSGQGSSVMNVHLQSNNSQEEKKLLNSFSEKDNKSSSSNDIRLNFDKPRHKTESIVDGSEKTDETNTGIKKDGNVQNESIALKYFQSALIDFVKELVKPTWKEGLMSKDAHKMIVKKAADKVLTTLESHQIPSTSESIKLYLSTSRPKIAKLVEKIIRLPGHNPYDNPLVTKLARSGCCLLQICASVLIKCTEFSYESRNAVIFSPIFPVICFLLELFNLNVSDPFSSGGLGLVILNLPYVKALDLGADLDHGCRLILNDKISAEVFMFGHTYLWSQPLDSRIQTLTLVLFLRLVVGKQSLDYV
ncbi:hypothetical protein ACJIZ3_013223 [Penstemon smallii]|uniref:C3H1-type domain-containing protein n=1 Tax=Penstemon smallii TaxID=265156 RepID=A0ABD3URC7_9LAMI